MQKLDFDDPNNVEILDIKCLNNEASYSKSNDDLGKPMSDKSASSLLNDNQQDESKDIQTYDYLPQGIFCFELFLTS